jgi:AcrR family transcriptional regulator
VAEVSETKRRILDTARALFNEHGLHRIGVRDIARELDMSPGNLAYHYRTKDDLVAALVLELHGQSGVWTALPPTFSLVTLYQVATATMRNTLPYRFILLSYADAVRSSPELQALSARLFQKRKARYDEMVELLAAGGWVVRRKIQPRLAIVYEQGEMISSGWLIAAETRPDLRGDLEAAIRHYARLGCALLEAYCTPKGARQLRQILAGEHG